MRNEHGEFKYGRDGARWGDDYDEMELVDPDKIFEQNLLPFKYLTPAEDLASNPPDMSPVPAVR